MLCDSTKTLLKTILQSLQTPDQVGWDDQIESGNQCLYEMHQMTRPSYRAYKIAGSDKWPTHVPDAAGLNRAMPHVKAMMGAIRRKDRATALQTGKAALNEMSGVAHIRPVETAKSKLAAPTAELSDVVQVPAGKPRPTVKNRVSAGRCRVAGGQ